MNPLFDPATLAGLRAIRADIAAPSAEASPETAAVGGVLEALAIALDHWLAGEPAAAVAVDGLNDAGRALLDQMLQRGEVAIRIAGDQPALIEETGLVGVWRLEDAGGIRLEVGDVPQAVRAAVATCPPGLIVPSAAELPAGTMNAEALLREIADHLALAPTAPPHEINLTLMPVSVEDMQVLGGLLGSGPVDILSRGYGACRIRATGRRWVWDVRHANSEDKVILHTLEVGDVPVAARATPEDLAETARRLHELRQS